MNKSENTIFYSIEKTIKSYRRYAQNKLKQVDSKITIDQCLILNKINDSENITQTDLAKLVFKDNASVSRIIDLMVKNGYLERNIDEENRRKYILEINKSTQLKLKKVNKVIQRNRAYALNGISEKELKQCEKTLNKIFDNLND